jgi:two-component system NarL family response regulator
MLSSNDQFNMKIRVLMVDDHPIVRFGLSAFLGLQDDIEVVGAAASGNEALSILKRTPVHIILIDLRMPGLSGIETLEKITAIAPNARSIVLSSFEYDEEIYAAVKAGAKGYLPKEGPADAIIDAIRLVHRGKQAFPRRIADSLSNRDLSAGLSIREKDVLALVAKGLTNKEVAGTLGLSQFTVRNHLMHIMEKLEATDRTEAIFIAIQTGLITLP